MDGGLLARTDPARREHDWAVWRGLVAVLAVAGMVVSAVLLLFAGLTRSAVEYPVDRTTVLTVDHVSVVAGAGLLITLLVASRVRLARRPAAALAMLVGLGAVDAYAALSARLRLDRLYRLETSDGATIIDPGGMQPAIYAGCVGLACAGLLIGLLLWDRRRLGER